MNVPRPDGKKWRKIVAQGCGGIVDAHTKKTVACRHDYKWTCESCPVRIDADRKKARDRF